MDDPDKKTVPVETVRRARRTYSSGPMRPTRKLLRPENRDLLPGQNALLKVLEEPPAYGVFLLLADNPDRLLPTVRSRCVGSSCSLCLCRWSSKFLRKAFPQAGADDVAAAPPQRRLLGQAMEALTEGGGWLPQTGDFVQAYSRRDPLRLLQVLVPMEKLKRDQLAPILSQWQELLTMALSCRSGMPARFPWPGIGRQPQLPGTVSGCGRFGPVLDHLKECLPAQFGNLAWQLQ